MSMYPQEIGTIPAETMRVARAAYPKGSLAMRLRDELGGLYQDEQFSSLFLNRTTRCSDHRHSQAGSSPSVSFNSSIGLTSHQGTAF